MLIFGATQRQLIKDSISWAGCQNNPIDVSFHFQKSLEIFDKNSADKIQSPNYKGVKVPCLVPIRVNAVFIFYVKCFDRENIFGVKFNKYDLFRPLTSSKAIETLGAIDFLIFPTIESRNFLQILRQKWHRIFF